MRVIEMTCLLFCCLFVLSLKGFSQSNEVTTHTIKGKVVSTTKDALSHITISLDGTSFWAITDKKGQFKLEIPEYLWQEEIFIDVENLGYRPVRIHFVPSENKNLKITMVKDDSEVKKGLQFYNLTQQQPTESN